MHRLPAHHSGAHQSPAQGLRLPALVLALVALLALSACSRRETPAAPSAGAGASAAGTPAAELRLGYFPNITHAPALIGVTNGYFQQELGTTKLTTQTFNAGPEEVSALLGGSLDAGFIGSSPAINAFAKSNGQAVRLVAGSTSGGAQLVVSPDITSADQLKGKIIATPQAGNTQDVALQEVAQGQQPHERHRPRRRDRAEHREPAHAWTCSSPARSPAGGCPSRGARGWSTPARRCSSTRRPCGRAASSPPPC